ncbi:hypothetical protein [Bosea sp. PAMC 26642]|uniref:hypothetical protein n=1 Tax=Bosea sp. (strain PAMC 26642) TaxID=1792307 RepID=UPI00143B22F9|nr:hypothetical protein [Bosea sp. PAMC 26642]
MRVAGLQRVARLAGEAFGHEEAAAVPGWRLAVFTRALLAPILGVAVALAVVILSLR